MTLGYLTNWLPPFRLRLVLLFHLQISCLGILQRNNIHDFGRLTIIYRNKFGNEHVVGDNKTQCFTEHVIGIFIL